MRLTCSFDHNFEKLLHAFKKDSWWKYIKQGTCNFIKILCAVMMECQFLSNQKSLLHGGYRYTNICQRAAVKVYWRCAHHSCQWRAIAVVDNLREQLRDQVQNEKESQAGVHIHVHSHNLQGYLAGNIQHLHDFCVSTFVVYSILSFRLLQLTHPWQM